MASILDRYGIKEVADVTFYEINADGTQGKPVLFLDSVLHSGASFHSVWQSYCPEAAGPGPADPVSPSAGEA